MRILLSHIPLTNGPVSFSLARIAEAFYWPLLMGVMDGISTPYYGFGLVSVILCALWTVGGQFTATRLLTQLIIGSVGGCLGSLWFWSSQDLWYYSVLHGCLWGSLVGYGVWRSQHLKA